MVEDLVETEDFEPEIEFYGYFGKCAHQSAYDHGIVIPGTNKTKDVWKKDEKYLKEILGCPVTKLKNKSSLNGTYTNRNKKQISHSSPQNVNKGDFSLRKANKDCRFSRSYDSNIDYYIPPLLNKSRLDWSKALKELREILILVEKKFKIYISGLYYNAPLPDETTNPKPDKKVKKGKKPNVIIEPESEDEGSISSISSSSSDESELSTNEQNTQSPTSAVVLSSTQPEIESDSDSDSNNSETNQVATVVPSETNQVAVLSENIALTHTEEEVNDFAASSSDSESSHSSRVDIYPSTSNRKASNAGYICKKDFMTELNSWEQREDEESQDELNIQLRTLFKEYCIINQDLFDIIFNELTIKKKVEYIKFQINFKYPLEASNVAGGINFHKAYDKYVK